ncbi:hypothetical protein [uncultured Aquimarina sp.]|uniref:hypothetical protein n=1 Tax=uncultured Aquimarina sp. TaxID=575652 RepID=UPI00262F4E8F|nr:hypothetical protein [uncultured Aquimarina sp.]
MKLRLKKSQALQIPDYQTTSQTSSMGSVGSIIDPKKDTYNNQDKYERYGSFF